MEPQYNPKQHALLLMNDKLEVLYGGAVAGGKSEGLLQAASQFLDIPGYEAMIFRRTYIDLSLPGALISRSMEWWKGTAAHWDGANHKWTFPEGSSLQFGYCEGPNDHYRYQGMEVQFIGFDELTQFNLEQYTYLFSRLRRLKVGPGANIPIRCRSATNPGGVGHEWVADRFNLPLGPDPRKSPNRAFISASLEDNPYLDAEEYEKSLAELPEVTRQQLRHGDWTITTSGGKFDPTKIHVIPPDEMPEPHEFTQIVRYWDIAGTAYDGRNDPDWTVGLKLGRTRFGRSQIDMPDWWILDVVRLRSAPDGVEAAMRQTARRDGYGIPIWIEQAKGTGKNLVQSYAANVLGNFEVHGLPPVGDKAVRAAIPAARVNEGRVYAIQAVWNRPLFAELGVFSEKEEKNRHDDQVDALSGAFIALDRQAAMGQSGPVRQH
jgi:predicted phage terminase large subunit-like protein